MTLLSYKTITFHKVLLEILNMDVKCSVVIDQNGFLTKLTKITRTSETTYEIKKGILFYSADRLILL